MVYTFTLFVFMFVKTVSTSVFSNASRRKKSRFLKNFICYSIFKCDYHLFFFWRIRITGCISLKLSLFRSPDVCPSGIWISHPQPQHYLKNPTIFFFFFFFRYSLLAKMRWIISHSTRGIATVCINQCIKKCKSQLLFCQFSRYIKARSEV